MPRALRLMLDLYENLEFEHDIIDSILNWIAYEGDLETVQYLEKKIIEMELDIIFLTSLCEFLEDISLEWSSLYNIVLAGL